MAENPYGRKARKKAPNLGRVSQEMGDPPAARIQSGRPGLQLPNCAVRNRPGFLIGAFKVFVGHVCRASLYRGGRNCQNTPPKDAVYFALKLLDKCPHVSENNAYTNFFIGCYGQVPGGSVFSNLARCPRNLARGALGLGFPFCEKRSFVAALRAAAPLAP